MSTFLCILPGIETPNFGYNRDVYRVLRLNRGGCTGDESRFADCSAFPLGDTEGVFSSSCFYVAGVQCITGLLCK